MATSTFCKEVHEFARAAETLLSPASLSRPLTKDECQIVKFYASSLTDYCNGLAYDEA